MGELDRDDASHAHAEGRLRRDLVAWLTTVTPAGQPQSTPVWFHWNGEDLMLLSQPGRPKLANIDGNPRVSVHLETEDRGDDVVTFEGLAVQVDALPEGRLAAYLAKYAADIERLGWTTEGFLADYSVVVHVTPTRVRAWT